MSPGKQLTDELDDVFRAIADPTRRVILDQLRDQPLNTSTLVAANDSMTRAGVISHIKILQAAGLIRVEERGRERINHLNAARLQGVYERWLNPFEQLWSSRLENLTRAVERGNTESEETAMNEPTVPAEPPVHVVEIVQQRSCAASAVAVWDALTNQVDQWWTSPYLSEDSIGLSIDLEPGGTMWDHRVDGGYAIAIVRGFTNGKELILDGEFGIPGALSGRLVVDLDQTDPTTTTITFTNTAMGAIPTELPDNENGWKALVAGLCDVAEKT